MGRATSPALTRSRSARIALAVAAVWAFVAGMAMFEQLAFGLGRFGGVEYVPRVVALKTTRFWGAWAAALAVSLLLTGALHDRTLAHASGADEPWRSRAARAVQAAVAVPLTYAPVCAVAMAGAIALGWAGYGLRPHAFFERLEGSDVAHGILWSLLLGAVPAAWSLLGRRVWGAPWRLWLKLLATYVAFYAASLLWELLGALVSGGASRG